MKRSKALRIGLGLVCGLGLLGLVSSSLAQEAQEEMRPDYVLQLAGYSFDPLRGELELPEELIWAEPPEDFPYYIVQLKRSLPREERGWLMDVYQLELTEYLGGHAYLERLSPETLQELESVEIVRWIGVYQPAFKLDPTIGKREFVSERRKAEPGVLLIAVAFNGANAGDLVAQVEELGYEIVGITDEEEYGILRLTVRVGTPEDAKQLALVPAIEYIEELGDVTLNNGTTSWVIQTNVNASRTIWDHGLQGEDQIIGHIDSLLDITHCFFRDDTDNTVRPDHRKVVGLRNAAGGTADDHGTHSAGNAIGEDVNNDAYSASPNASNGNAPRARITHGYLYDLDWISGGTVSFYSYLIQAQGDGAFIHTNSWDDKSTSDYTQLSVDLDRFAWENEDSLVIIGPNNFGSICPPDTSKNALVVNQTEQSPNQDDFRSGIDEFTLDGRRKPDLMAPGCTASADVGTTCSTITSCGTSFAAPSVAGAAALVRQYYTEGWYPTGTQQPHHAFTPSGALLKATLLNGTVDATGITGYPGTANTGEGWGRLLLENSLYFDGDGRNSRVWDVRHDDGLATGESDTHNFSIDGNGEALKVTLVWTEPPGTAGSATPVVNNLDLVVTSPTGQTFLGNRFVNGVSAVGGSADSLNNVEMVLVNTPAIGNWTITVSGTSVNVGDQGYALVVTADLPEPPVSTGTQDTLVVRVKFSDVAYEPSLPNLQNTIQDVIDYFDEVTYGEATINPDYRGPITLSHARSFYYDSTRTLLIELTEEVIAKLILADPNVFTQGTTDPSDDIDRMIIVTNDSSFSEDWATTGPWPYSMPTGLPNPISVSIQGYQNSVARFTHGLGHQFGLVDLYAYPRVTFPRAYVDDWDNMSNIFNNAHFLVWSKERAEWVTQHGSQIEYVPRPAAGTTTTQTYHLHLQESTGTNLKAVAIGLTEGAATLSDEDVFYFVEARSNTLGGYDDTLPASGVLIYYVNELIPQGEGPVRLEDKDINTLSLGADAAFVPSDSYPHTLPGTGIEVTVSNGTSGGDYDIKIVYSPPATDYNVRITRGDTVDGNFYAYFSPDIWVDSPKNGLGNLASGPPAHADREHPVEGTLNYIYARIHNDGPASSYDFDVEFRVSSPYHTVGGEPDFNRYVWTEHVTELKMVGSTGSPTILRAEWIPDKDKDAHRCIRVEIKNLKGTDTNPNDSWAQENVQVQTSTTSSPYTPVTYQYSLTNPYSDPALFYFRVEGAPTDWTLTLNPRKVYLAPGERTIGSVTIQPPPTAEVCTEERVTVTSWTPQGDTLIPLGGGVVQVNLRRSTALTLDVDSEPCRDGEDEKLIPPGRPFDDCRRIVATGCTNPSQPYTEIVLKYIDPVGDPVYRTVTTDAYGCYEDFLVVVDDGQWVVQAEFEGDDCQGPAEASGTICFPREEPCQVCESVYDKLIDLHPDGTLLPQLATSWEVSEDGDRVRFWLREGVFFHDETEFTAEDVRRNLTNDVELLPGLIRPAQVGAGVITGVEVIDDYTVDIMLGQPDPAFILRMTGLDGMMASQHTVEETGAGGGPYAGAGPFKIVFYTGEEFALEAFDAYWGPAPSASTLQYLIVPDESMRFLMLEAGDVDIAVGRGDYDYWRFASDEEYVVCGDPGYFIVARSTLRDFWCFPDLAIRLEYVASQKKLRIAIPIYWDPC